MLVDFIMWLQISSVIPNLVDSAPLVPGRVIDISNNVKCLINQLNDGPLLSFNAVSRKSRKKKAVKEDSLFKMEIEIACFNIKNQENDL